MSDQHSDYISILTNSGFFSQQDAIEFSNNFEDIIIVSDNEYSYCLVLKARKHGKWYIIKRLRPEYSTNPIYIQLLEKEFDLAYQLDHPYIARVYDKYYDDNGLYIVVEYIDGITLREFTKRVDLAGNERVLTRIIHQLNEALSYIHTKQIIHRDLKPENILITHNGYNVKLIDFGLSDADFYYAFKSPAGTRRYASPEQLKKSHPITYKSDYYSLGLIILEVLTNEVSPDALVKLQNSYTKLVNGCLQINPSERYGYEKVMEALDKDKKVKKTAFSWKFILLLSAIALFFAYWGFKDLMTSNIGILDNKDTFVSSDDSLAGARSDSISFVQKNKIEGTTLQEDVPALTPKVTTRRTFFHNEADVSTKRKAFLDPGDIIYPLSYINGFYYIEFINPNTQKTSKGWVQVEDFDKYDSPISLYGGTYRYFGENDGLGVVVVYPEKANEVLFYIGLNRGAPSYNMGSLYGRVKIIDGKGIFFKRYDYGETGCKLSFTFTKNSLRIETIDPDDYCEFGNGVYADGIFDKASNDIPGYFEDLDGSKIYFKNTKPEDYE